MKPENSQAGTICRACQSRYEGGVVFCPKDGTKLEPDAQAGPASLVGQVLAERYRVLKKLGEGGMGEVFEASHVYIDKKFAIKLLRPEITSNAEAVARFHQEARSASSIGHENIIAIDDFGRLADGSVYLAMELLEGVSLADRMKNGPVLEFPEYLAVTLQVCAGLSAAHNKGIIHRDMKPANIFLTEKHGQLVVKVLDFGIAKVGGDTGQQALTRTGQIFGTPQYMSPEQALGRPLDGRSDIYSVGVIMYELATGRVPFESDSFMGILTQHITARAIPPTQLAPGVPPQFEQVIGKAMAKDPAERYASMEELGHALAQVAGELAPALGRPSQAYSAIQFEAGKSNSGVSVPRSGAYVPATGALRKASQPMAVAGMAGPASVAMAAAPPAKSGAGLWIALGGLGIVLAGGAIAVFLFMKPTIKPAVGELPQAVVAPKLPPKAGPKLLEVVVDTEPSGAKVMAQGKAIAETPDVVKVPEGTKLTVTLVRTGSIEKTVVIDPAKDRKVMVKLEPKVVPKPVEPPVVVGKTPPSKGGKHGSSSSKSGKTNPVTTTTTNKKPPSEVLDPYQ